MNAHGLLPRKEHENSSGDPLGPEVGVDWMYLSASLPGKADRETSPEEVERIANILRSSWD